VPIVQERRRSGEAREQGIEVIMSSNIPQESASVSGTAIKPRKWWAAGLFSLFIPGLGQIYNGQAKKGTLFYFLAQGIVIALFVIMVMAPSFILYLGVFPAIFAVHVFIILDAAFTAHRSGRNYQLRFYNKAYAYVLIIVFAGLALGPSLSYAWKEFLVEAYRLPSASMTPTFLPGDRLLVDKFTQASKNPERGDIIVFQYPKDKGRVFVKRVVGVAGDVVELRDKQLFINSDPVSENYVEYTMEGPRSNFGPVTVTPNSFFVMGDNRDNSQDSRVFGLVEKNKVIGKVRAICWSWDREHGHMRWERIGSAVQ